MLVIRDVQIKAFEDRKVQDFQQRLAEHLASKYGLDLDHSLQARVARGIGTAERYGIITERGAATFLEWTIEEGESFHVDPARPLLGQILLDTDLSEPFKLDILSRSRAWTPAADDCSLEDVA
jgi:hypothetical protein